MAKKKVEKTLTIEEKLEQEKQRGINMIKREVPFLSEPTYSFSVGDKVEYGCLKQCVVDDVMYDGKVYGLKCIATNNNYGKPYDYETYRVVSWVSVRPLEFGNTNFSKNQDVKIYFNNTTIEGLMHHHYHFGIDFEPDYQRGYVWEQEDKEFLLDSIFNNIDIGKFVLIRLSDEEWGERGLSYEILDGKQRLSTIIEFYENRLSYKGKFYNELGSKDRNVFKQHNVSFAEVDNVDKKSILKYFLMLNRTGKAMDKAHLESVESLLKDMEKSR
mgnify:CR=1 FL=1